MEKFWKHVDEHKPHCFERGDWDGLRSESILFVDKSGVYYIGNCYYSFIGGSNLWDFISDDGYIIDNTTHWSIIPEII